MAKRGNGFEKDPKRASEAGKKSKRPVSIKKIWEKALEGELPKPIRDALDNATILIDGKPVKFSNKLMSKNGAEAFAYVGLTAAMLGDHKFYKQVEEQIDGKAKESIEMSGGLEVTTNNQAEREFIEKHGLAKRT